MRHQHSSAESCDVPEALWASAVAIMYGGHEALGWRFVDMAWKPGFPGNGTVSQDCLLDELRGRLAESEYWPELHERMLKNGAALR